MTTGSTRRELLRLAGLGAGALGLGGLAAVDEDAVRRLAGVRPAG